MLGRFSRGSFFALVVAFAACKSGEETEVPVDAGPTELCQEPETESNYKVRITPRTIVLAPGETREVAISIEPDVCKPTPIPIAVQNQATAKVEGTFTADLQTAQTTVKVTGTAAGKTTMTATWGPSVATLEIDVRAKDLPACAEPAKGNLAPGGTVKSGNAVLALSAGAAKDEGSIDPLELASVVEPFEADISCKTDHKVPDGYLALGPAVSFGPQEKRFLRELTFEIPANPAVIPATANMRHVRVLWSSLSLKEPRFVPVTNPRFEPRGNDWVLRFEAPRLGTYQATVMKNGGTVKKKRKLTHRAVFGFSMGGIGSSMFGMNHHDMFDAVVPLGGPMDAGFFMPYAMEYHFGGFCERKAGDPIPDTPCKAEPRPPSEMYLHVQSFENWWHQKGVDGTGGTFGRDSMVSIFRDVASAWGDPGFNNPLHPHVAMGIENPSPMIEDAPADYCNDPAKSTIAATGFYDRRYNPDGALPVIKFCDGRSQPGFPGKWAPDGTKPLEMALAVDLNKNGKRDEGEPVIVQPHEPFSDFGKDGQSSLNEPGYDPVLNPDPAGDDYDPQYNPLGTEGNHVWDEGEPFEDLGLDGVKCPAPGTCKYDVGEGNGKFDISKGLETFFARDARMQIEGHPFAKTPAGGPWTDQALDNLDVYSDGGIRDIFNWGTVGYHYMGAFAAKNRPMSYYNDWEYLPNINIKSCVAGIPSDCFDPKDVDWSAMGKTAYLRYGNIDSKQRMIEKGDGQHVGYTDQVLRRVQTGLFYIGSRWPDADKKYAEDPPRADETVPCAANSSCTYTYTDKSGRAGPVTVILPPGYHSDASKGLRYPTVYFLHGYGQTPEDLQAFVLLVSPLMGHGLSSRATRLEKMIMVFVDGRCRGDSKDPECVRGTFYVDSVRDKGPKMDRYFLDLINHVETTYRTMGPSEVEVTE